MLAGEVIDDASIFNIKLHCGTSTISSPPMVRSLVRRLMSGYANQHGPPCKGLCQLSTCAGTTAIKSGSGVATANDASKR
jgi:hypothetical protein